MLRFLKLFILALVLVIMAGPACAFSLLGPLDARYQTVELGYNPYNRDLGGPMNRGEEYRWNSPAITYGFDKSFLDYFGPKGVEAVDQAVAILNNLPAMSLLSADLREFPAEAKRVNYRASALGIIDLKSMALGILVEELGLACPERYTWTLRDRRVIENIPRYLVIQRNFDPVTWGYSAYVNGTLYTYRIGQIDDEPVFYDAVESSVDPLAFTFTTVASISGSLFGGLGSGEFFTSLTRDDVGGLRYLYRRLNINGENVIAGTSSAGPLEVDPFGFPFVFDIPANDPYGFPSFITNAPTQITTNVFGTTNAVVDAAFRPGIDKIYLQKMEGDSIFGFFQTITNSYTDVYLTNSVVTPQRVRRLMARPDILFLAGDLGLDVGGFPILYTRTTADTWDNNRDLNTLSSSVNTAGPGVITPFVEIAFSSLGPFNRNLDFEPFLIGRDLTEVGTWFFSSGATWGSFDGTTNAPVLFPPDRITLEELERQVLGGN